MYCLDHLPAREHRRIVSELNDGAGPGGRVNRKRVARVMREHGIRGYTKRRRVRTTIAAEGP